MPGGLLSHGIKEVKEDWMDATVIGTSATTAGIKWMNSSDAGNTAFVALDATDVGCVCQGATDGTDQDMMEIAHRALAWYVQNGILEMETRIRVTVGSIATIAINVGFNDDQLDDSNDLPVTISGTTFTTNASTWMGVVVTGLATNDDWHAFYVNADSDCGDAIADLRFVGSTPTLNKWVGIRIACRDRGTGKGARMEITIADEATGKVFQKVLNTTVLRTTALVPHIAFKNQGATAHTFQIDYIYARQSMAATT
jgi:hypothetical protein